MAETRFSVIIIGGGTMGSATAWALAKRGISALVLEQFDHIHDLGSHGAHTRIIRHAYHEGASYVPLVLQADALWQELEQVTDRQILYRTGGLDLGDAASDEPARAKASADAYGLSVEWLTGAEIRYRWPAWRVDDDWVACYSPDGGFLDVAAALRSLAERATAQGVVIQTREPVRDWSPQGSEVRVRTDRATYVGERLIVTAGAWSAPLLADLDLPLEVRRKVVWWFDTTRPELYEIGRFPIYLCDLAAGAFYGFPRFQQVGVKLGDHRGGQTVTPETVDRTAHLTDTPHVATFVLEHLAGMTDRRTNSAVCLYTMSPDEHFIIDRHPAWPNVVFAAGFSGHGFKFASAIGEHLADLAISPQAAPYEQFRLGRFGAG